MIWTFNGNHITQGEVVQLFEALSKKFEVIEDIFEGHIPIFRVDVDGYRWNFHVNDKYLKIVTCHLNKPNSDLNAECFLSIRYENISEFIAENELRICENNFGLRYSGGYVNTAVYLKSKKKRKSKSKNKEDFKNFEEKYMEHFKWLQVLYKWGNIYKQDYEMLMDKFTDLDTNTSRRLCEYYKNNTNDIIKRTYEAWLDG